MSLRYIKLIVASAMVTMALVGCGNDSEKSTEIISKKVNDVKEVDPEEKDKYDSREANATRTHFQEDIKELNYYIDGKKYDIKVDSEEGKTIVKMMKNRIASCEFLDKDTLVDKSGEIKNKSALEVKFDKETKGMFYDSKNEEYKEVKFDGLLMPLEGEYSQRLLLSPEESGTFTISGKPDELKNYLKLNIK